MPTILLTGPVGVGKTTVLGEMSALLAEARVPHAAVDLDALTMTWPRPPGDDLWGTRIGLANLAALWRNFADVGARCLVVARVVEARAELDGYRQAVPGAQVVVVRLRAPVRTLHARLRRRGSGLGLEWHLARAAGLAPLMDARRVEDLLVETARRNPTAVARDALVRLGWLGLP